MEFGELEAVRHRLAALIPRHLAEFERRFGYQPDENRVVLALVSGLAPDITAKLPSDLRAFFRYFDRIELPDFWNGYFIGPASTLVNVFEAREPRSVLNGSTEVDVAVVGSDGGGTLYAVPLSAGGPVLRLPPSAIIHGAYRPPPGRHVDDLAIAADFDDFLTELVDGLERMVRHGSAGPFN